MSSFDHLGIYVTDYEASSAFYEKVLSTLGIGVATKVDFDTYTATAFGKNGKPDFWVGASKGHAVTKPLHIAFAALDSHAVDAFYKVAIEAGARDNGAPGIRQHYHPGYYGAFVFDPDGNNIEAVYHGGVSA